MNVTLNPLTMPEALSHIRAALRAGRVVNAVSLNVAKLVSLRRDHDLRRDVAAASLLLADGMGIVWGARLLGVAIPERVAGVDLMDRMLEACAEEGWRPYFLGARPEVVENAVAAARRRHPTLSVAGWQHGYYDNAALPTIVAAIRNSGATCLFVGMPTPRKEQFLAHHAANLGVPFLMGVGGGLDILAGVTARAPRAWQDWGFEWLYRLIQEPRRMWRRYLTTNMMFAGLLAASLARHWLQQFRKLGPRATTSSSGATRGPLAAKSGIDDTTVHSRSGRNTDAVRCRAIGPPDLPAVAALLRVGFPNRPENWFANALASLARHRPPPGFPQFGYVLDCDGQIVGALLVIASACHAAGREQIRRNASCWYVQPAFRVFAPILIGQGSRRCEATDVNISPAPQTWPILEAQGFKRFSDGLFITIPLFNSDRSHAPALTWEGAKSAGWPISDAQEKILREHESYGCLGLVCCDEDGVAVCVLRQRRFRRIPLTGVQVIFCERPDDFGRFASAIAYQLLRRGYVWVALNANSRVAGLRGLWFPGRAPMYYRGADKPASGDLLYTEAALFGF